MKREIWALFFKRERERKKIKEDYIIIGDNKEKRKKMRNI